MGTDGTFALSNPAPLPASQTAGVQGQTLTLTFAAGTFTGGDIYRFTIGRGLTKGPSVAGGTSSPTGASLGNYNADNFGGGVLIPEGTIVLGRNARFSGTIEGGGTLLAESSGTALVTDTRSSMASASSTPNKRL